MEIKFYYLCFYLFKLSLNFVKKNLKTATKFSLLFKQTLNSSGDSDNLTFVSCSLCLCVTFDLPGVSGHILMLL